MTTSGSLGAVIHLRTARSRRDVARVLGAISAAPAAAKATMFTTHLLVCPTDP
jgi:hypothetical protein